MEETLGPDTDFPKLIGQLRANVGLSMAQASARANISLSQWHRAENGQSPQLTLYTSLRMLKAVGWRIGLTLDRSEPQS